jgi:hypothetical protein
MSSDSAAILQEAKKQLDDAYKKSGMGWNEFLIAIGTRRNGEPPMANPTEGAGATTPAGATGMFSGMKDRFSGMKNPFAGGPGIDWTGAVSSALFRGGRKSMKQSKSRKQGKSRKQRETRK